jgi:hypothetical protein
VLQSLRGAAWVAFLGLAAPVWPQQSLSASIHGVVVDREGTVCEGAHITLAQAASVPPPARSATSDASGRFEFSGLPPGAFTLIISAKGFATQVVTGVLHSGESYNAPQIAMLVTAAQSEVRVSASQEEIAQAQFHQEEKQRVLGVIPNFFVSYAPGAPPLTSKQKFHLASVSLIDPITLLSTGFFAGIEQADNSFGAYGQGAQGYAKRYAANYADNVAGTMIGSAMLPSLFKQDPRYFYKGTGSKRSRFAYAVAMSVVCKGDNGRWQANYSGIFAGFASGAISNLYYPAADRNGVSVTFENLGVGTGEAAVENLFQEFFLRRLTPKLLNYNSSTP